MPADPKQVKSIFLAAVDRVPAERAAFLDAACGGDADLRRRAEELLCVHDEPGGLPGVPDHETPVASEPTAAGSPGEGAAGAVDLSFLAPSEKPGSLGRLGHYEVLEVVGQGGMGVVFRAFDEQLHRVVAIKVMAPMLAASGTARKRFAREAQAAAAVRNDHVIDIHAVEEHGEPPYLVMEFIAGQSLQEWIDQSGPLELKEILRIGMQTAAGLAAAHAQGLIHRDIKPANILLENGVQRVKITDFGLARAVDDASLTQSGVVAGTPQYMSPEQARGDAVDHRTDLFSLGSVLYAMCTGRPPFRASSSLAVLRRVEEDAPHPIPEIRPEIPQWLVEIIDQLLAKNPAERYSSAAELAGLLGQFLAHLQQPALIPQPPGLSSGAVRTATTPPHRPRRRLAVALLAVAAGLALTERIGVTSMVATLSGIFSREDRIEPEGQKPDQPVASSAPNGKNRSASCHPWF
jgi:serine/threonine protein kinase